MTGFSFTAAYAYVGFAYYYGKACFAVAAQRVSP